jgi:hypothetical protein
MRLRSALPPATSPNASTLPLVSCCTPTSERISVDLPHPLGPSSPVTLPSSIMNPMPFSTSRPPRRTTRSLTSTAFFIMW